MGLYWHTENIKRSTRASDVEEFVYSDNNKRILELGKSFMDGDDFTDIAFVASAYGGFK